MPRFNNGERVRITNDTYYRNGEAGYIERISEGANGIMNNYLVRFTDGQKASFFEANLRKAPDKGDMEKTLKDLTRIGSISTYFVEARFYIESDALSNIREVTHRDVTSGHFAYWFFKTLDFEDYSPRDFPFISITHSDEINVYGYFNGNKLDGIIRVDEYEDTYVLSFFYVNEAVQNQGIGQYLLRFVLDKFKDKNQSLYVYKDNARAIYIYKKYGFKIAGEGYDRGYRPGALHYLMVRDIKERRHYEKLRYR